MTTTNTSGVIAIKPSPVSGKRILFINAGSRKKRITFEEAMRLGLSITLVHPGKRTYADAYCDYKIDSTGKSSKEILAEILVEHKKLPFDGVITFLEEDVEFTALVAKKLGLIGISEEGAAIARNKYMMRQCLSGAKVPVPRAMLVATMNEAIEAAKTISFPLVIKPFKGTDSMWVTKVESVDGLVRAFTDLTKYAKHPYEAVVAVEIKKYVMEEYMSGSEISAEVLVQNGAAQVVGIIDKLPMIEPFFIERGDVCPSRFPTSVQEKIKEVAKQTVAAIGHNNGVAHIEMKITAEGPKIIEIAARMGGDYICDWIESIYGVNLAREAILIALGHPINVRILKPRMHLRGEYFIPEEDSLLKDVSGIQEIQKIQKSPHVHNLYIWAHKGDILQTPPRGFDTAGWLVVSGTTVVEVDARMVDMKKMVRIEFEPVAKHKGERSDIVESSARQSIGFPKKPETINISILDDMIQARLLWEQYTSGSTNPMLDWEFREAFSRGYGQNFKFIIATDGDGKNVGFLPLQYVEDRKRWEFFGTSWFEENVFFVKNEQILRQILTVAPRPLCLNDIDYHELKRFQSLPLDFDEEKYVLDMRGWTNAEQVFEVMSSHRRHVICGKIKKFDSLNPTVSDSDWEGAIDEMIRLNKKRFGDHQSFTPARTRAFQEVYKANFSKLKRRIITLKVGKKVAAVGLALCNGERYVGLNAGWDLESFPCVERALIFEKIKDALKQGCTYYDALANDYGWKNNWGLSAIPLYFLAIDEIDGN